jgi:hypothetical protein
VTGGRKFRGNLLIASPEFAFKWNWKRFRLFAPSAARCLAKPHFTGMMPGIVGI